MLRVQKAECCRWAVLVCAAVLFPPAGVSANSVPTTAQPTVREDRPADAQDDFISTRLTAIAALITALGGAFAAFWAAVRKSRKEARSEIDELLNSYQRLEAGMRMVLTKVPESAALWEVIFSKLRSDAHMQGIVSSTLSRRKMRKEVVEMVLGEIFLSPELQAKLMSLIVAQNPVTDIVRKGWADLSPQQLAEQGAAVLRHLHFNVRDEKLGRDRGELLAAPDDVEDFGE